MNEDPQLYLGVPFQKLSNVAKSGSCDVFEKAITDFFKNAHSSIVKLDNVRCILPLELSNRLLIAVASRSYQCTALKVYLLVNKHHADVNAIALEPNPYGDCVLSMALTSRRDDAAMALLDLGANANLSLGRRGQHPLIDTAFKGCPLVLELMFKHGADFKITNGWGNTVLVAAITRGHVESVKFLLEIVKLDPNMPGGSGLCVMEIEDTDVPMEHDVSWNVRRDLMWTPLHAAVHLKHPDGVEIVKLLINAGANVHQRCELPRATFDGVECLGYTPLEILTVHTLLRTGYNFRHDPAAMAECKTILENAMSEKVGTVL
jgi:hypothetical protein